MYFGFILNQKTFANFSKYYKIRIQSFRIPDPGSGSGQFNAGS